MADYARAIELNDQNDWARCERADLLVLLGRYDEALTDYRRAIEIDSEYTYALVQRAELHAKLGQYDLAMADFDRAVETDPAPAWVLAHRGDMLLDQYRYTEAAENFDRALVLDPSYWWARMRRAWMLCVLRRYDESQSEYLAAAEQKPEDAYAAVGVTRTTLLQGQDASSLVELSKAAVTVSPEAAEAHYYLGILLLRQGQPDAGRRSISYALDLARQEYYDEADETDRASVGLCLAASGDYDLADRYLSSLRGIDPELALLIIDELCLLPHLPGIDSHQITRLIERL